VQVTHVPLRWMSAVLLLLATGGALAHGGGVNAEGCHTNRKTGDYHCHGGSNHSKSVDPAMMGAGSSRLGSERAITSRKTLNAGGTTCHVGPRGGTYTITKSGRKNYAGC
jgi:hypothetical protein